MGHSQGKGIGRKKIESCRVGPVPTPDKGLITLCGLYRLQTSRLVCNLQVGSDKRMTNCRITCTLVLDTLL